VVKNPITFQYSLLTVTINLSNRYWLPITDYFSAASYQITKDICVRLITVALRKWRCMRPSINIALAVYYAPCELVVPMILAIWNMQSSLFIFLIGWSILLLGTLSVVTVSVLLTEEDVVVDAPSLIALLWIADVSECRPTSVTHCFLRRTFFGKMSYTTDGVFCL